MHGVPPDIDVFWLAKRELFCGYQAASASAEYH